MTPAVIGLSSSTARAAVNTTTSTTKQIAPTTPNFAISRTTTCNRARSASTNLTEAGYPARGVSDFGLRPNSREVPAVLDVSLTEEQEQLRKTVEHFARTVV